jgi:hypothetical protein
MVLGLLKKVKVTTIVVSTGRGNSKQMGMTDYKLSENYQTDRCVPAVYNIPDAT